MLTPISTINILALGSKVDKKGFEKVEKMVSIGHEISEPLTHKIDFYGCRSRKDGSFQYL
ncbi:uncharacterized protein CANTADRAFT_27020, partial [Suhomyces tanzawaensis NRRL Y-17324]